LAESFDAELAEAVEIIKNLVEKNDPVVARMEFDQLVGSDLRSHLNNSEK